MNRWVKRSLIAFGVLLIVALAVPFLVPLGTYIPIIEKEASSAVGESVSIAGLHAALLPSPRLILEKIVIGGTQGATIAAIRVSPDLSSLLRPVKIITTLEIDSPVVTQNALAGISGRYKPSSGPAHVVIERVHVTNARIELKNANLPELNADVVLDPEGGFSEAVIESVDKRLHLAANPQGREFLIKAEAKDWQPAPDLKLVIADLHANALAGGKGVKINSFSAKSFNGKITGNANVSWQNDWGFKGVFDVNNADLRSIAPLLSPDLSVSGRLFSKGSFSSKAKEAAKLMDALRLDADFNVKDGIIYNVDVAHAAQSLIKQGTKGGQTKFDELSGKVELSDRVYSFKQLNVTSGVLNATGNVDIFPSRQLGGRINAKIKKGVALLDVPLNVSGTVKEPVLFPTKSAMAGAAVGTAILGPGVGTGLGMKAGDALNKLFGKKQQDSPPPGN